tara:strand:+ start:6647 stop:7285 length:639 start_codon:yes stop_codon:yes gene_type:complete
MTAKLIQIAGGDQAFYEMLREQLEWRGEYACQYAADEAHALGALREGTCDLVVLCRSQAGELAGDSDLPVVQIVDEGPGGDGVVVRPFRFGDLMLRLRQRLKAHESSEDAAIRIGPYAFRPSAKTLTDSGADAGETLIRLTEKEANILKYLFRAGTNVVSREELLTEVWGYNSGVTTHTLETHIYRLRQKIERDPSNAVMLVTDAGGYRLMP